MNHHRYICYKNGPFYSLFRFLLHLINPFNWKHVELGWVIWSIKINLPRKHKYPKQEFDYFMKRHKTKIEWFKEYNYIKQ